MADKIKYTGWDIKKILAEKKLDTDSQFRAECLDKISKSDVERALSSANGIYSFEKLTALISPAAQQYLEDMAQSAHQLTVQRFGKTIRLYAPLYLSNYCVNSCRYCGFNKDSQFKRIRLTIDQTIQQADLLADKGFKDILLVSSEDRQFISIEYLTELAGKLKKKFSSISAEIYQISEAEYAELFKAGIEGITIYQETYDRQAYSRFHPAGPKSDYDNRLNAPDHIAAAGMRQVGLGALLGLTNWRTEALALAEHAHYLMKRHWQCRISFSFPRLQPAHLVSAEQFGYLLSDKNLVQMIVALRLCFANAGMVLSTRENAGLRDRLIKLGITKLSAGSKTSPGGYCDHIDTVEQFEVNDSRSPAQIAEMIKTQGIEPVWKDWDRAFTKS